MDGMKKWREAVLHEIAEQGVTQKEIAQKVGIPQSMLSQAMAGGDGGLICAGCGSCWTPYAISARWQKKRNKSRDQKPKKAPKMALVRLECGRNKSSILPRKEGRKTNTPDGW